MCFVLLSWRQQADYPLILAANRDEFLARPALALQAWEDAPGVVGGRDLESGGSWLALNRDTGRFVLVTNVRQGKPRPAPRSRGLLIRDLVNSSQSLAADRQMVERTRSDYAGFNLLLGQLSGTGSLYYFSNASDTGWQPLEPGIHGLSNAALDTPWPKVVQGRRQLQALLEQTGAGEPEAEGLFALLGDAARAPDAALPDTGIGMERERILSSAFIPVTTFGDQAYGTRCSTVLVWRKDGYLRLQERSFVPGIAPDTVRLTLDLP
ncbi:MAG: NRDE family protein [Thiothrix sp.]|nr:NRDE family protein [Thiothrix sp.]HPE60678.1 NRDE family protein [Thiolinea sp.]